MELPPRARRIPQAQTTNLLLEGTTSACAENTFPSTIEFSVNRNYLRVRGEYRFGLIVAEIPMELPPRARRIRGFRLVRNFLWGTTSACAENTPARYCQCAYWWNYLRVRGEYTPTNPGAGKSLELPPRARRIRYDRNANAIPIGTTSACAENTTPCKSPQHPSGNYLRVRGEYRLPPA